MHQQRVTRVGQSHGAGGALEQWGAEARFQAGDDAGDRGLRLVQALGAVAQHLDQTGLI